VDFAPNLETMLGMISFAMNTDLHSRHDSRHESCFEGFCRGGIFFSYGVSCGFYRFQWVGTLTFIEVAIILWVGHGSLSDMDISLWVPR
jgi:hypothetical protein